MINNFIPYIWQLFCIKRMEANLSQYCSVFYIWRIRSIRPFCSDWHIDRVRERLLIHNNHLQSPQSVRFLKKDIISNNIHNICCRVLTLTKLNHHRIFKIVRGVLNSKYNTQHFIWLTSVIDPPPHSFEAQFHYASASTYRRRLEGRLVRLSVWGALVSPPFHYSCLQPLQHHII